MGTVVEFKPKSPDTEEAAPEGHPHMPQYYWQCNCGHVLFYLSPEGQVCYGCGKLLTEYPAP